MYTRHSISWPSFSNSLHQLGLTLVMTSLRPFFATVCRNPMSLSFLLLPRLEKRRQLPLMSSPSSLLKHTTARWRWERSPPRPSLLLHLEGKSQRSTRPPTKALVEAMAGMVSSRTEGGESVWDI